MASLLAGSRTDRLILLLALIAILAGWFCIQQRWATGEGAVVVLYRGETLLATYPLPAHGERHIFVDGVLGQSEVVLSPRGVRIAESPCHTKYCVHSGLHHRIGDIVACVPNHLLVVIQGHAASSLDAVVE